LVTQRELKVDVITRGLEALQDEFAGIAQFGEGGVSVPDGVDGRVDVAGDGARPAEVPRANTNLPTIAAAERLSDLIRGVPAAAAATEGVVEREPLGDLA